MRELEAPNVTPPPRTRNEERYGGKKRSEPHVRPASQRRSPCSVWEASRVTAAPRKIRQPQVQEQPSLAHAQTRWRYGHTLRSKLTGCEKKPKYTLLIRPIWQFIDDENFQKATKLEPHVSSKRSQCDFQRPAGWAGEEVKEVVCLGVGGGSMYGFFFFCIQLRPKTNFSLDDNWLWKKKRLILF